MHGQSAFPLACSNQFSGTGAGRFLTGDGAYRFSEYMAHLCGGTQSSQSEVRGASSCGSNVVSRLVPPGSREGFGIFHKRLGILGILD